MLSAADRSTDNDKQKRGGLVAPAPPLQLPLSLNYSSLPPPQYSQQHSLIDASFNHSTYAPRLTQLPIPREQPSNYKYGSAIPLSMLLNSPDVVYPSPQNHELPYPVAPDYLRQILTDRLYQVSQIRPKAEQEIVAPEPEPFTPPALGDSSFLDPDALLCEDSEDDVEDDEADDNLDPITPDHYFEDTVPVFRPVRNFFCFLTSLF